MKTDKWQSSNGQKNQLEGEKFADIASFLGLCEVQQLL